MCNLGLFPAVLPGLSNAPAAPGRKPREDRSLGSFPRATGLSSFAHDSQSFLYRRRLHQNVALLGLHALISVAEFHSMPEPRPSAKFRVPEQNVTTPSMADT